MIDKIETDWAAPNLILSDIRERHRFYTKAFGRSVVLLHNFLSSHFILHSYASLFCHGLLMCLILLVGMVLAIVRTDLTTLSKHTKTETKKKQRTKMHLSEFDLDQLAADAASALEKVKQSQDSKAQQAGGTTPVEINGTTYSVPNRFLCPITLTIMEKPLVSRHGQRYERAAILSWLAKSDNCSCPLTRQPLYPSDLIVDHRMASEIYVWRKARGIPTEAVPNDSESIDSETDNDDDDSFEDSSFLLLSVASTPTTMSYNTSADEEALAELMSRNISVAPRRRESTNAVAAAPRRKGLLRRLCKKAFNKSS